MIKSHFVSEKLFAVNYEKKCKIPYYEDSNYCACVRFLCGILLLFYVGSERSNIGYKLVSYYVKIINEIVFRFFFIAILGLILFLSLFFEVFPLLVIFCF